MFHVFVLSRFSVQTQAASYIIVCKVRNYMSNHAYYNCVFTFYSCVICFHYVWLCMCGVFFLMFSSCVVFYCYYTRTNCPPGTNKDLELDLVSSQLLAREQITILPEMLN